METDMKVASKIPLLLFTLGATLAAAQISQGTFKHIIIVVQENRTPDNLFGAGAGAQRSCGSEYDFEPGVDIDNGGYGIPYQSQRQLICNIPLSLTGIYSVGTKVDPDHSHEEPQQDSQNYGQPGGWVADYDGGNPGMDGFCHEYDTSTWNGICPSYSYVPQAQVQPYFDIASYYGFANYMFQTNQGPSLPAHQFLFAGTSAPVPVNDPSGEWTWFDAELNFAGNNTCTATPGADATLIDSTGKEPSYNQCKQNPTDPHCAQPCYERAPSPYNWGSLADLLGANKVTWKYYAPSKNSNGSISDGLWVAPAAIDHFCVPTILGGTEECSGLISGQYASNMVWETSEEPVPITNDITSCNLAQVSWVIPDALWSDHAAENNGTGPSYVANIVNTLGNNPACPTTKEVYWNDTAIFVTWDDWGGWYDHVNPNSPGGPGVNQNQGTWGAYYTYGFRVPLLVVSAYTGTYNQQTKTYSGYVSGACGASPLPSCPNFGQNKLYVHDFGSILAFTEWNFKIPIGSIGQDNYPFADNYAPELPKNVPLLDLFPLTAARPFQQIIIPPGYGVSYFQNYFTNNPGASPSGPDATDGDQ